MQRRAAGARAWTTSSASRLVAPSTEVGSAALSVEMWTNRSTCRMLTAASSRCCVPSTFVFTPSHGCRSSSGRCLCAAAWNTSSGRVLGEDLIDPLPVPDVGDDDARRCRAGRPASSSCSACRLDSSWSSMIQRGRVEPVDLAAQLGADRAAGAGDQDPAAVDQVAGAIGCDMHLVPAEQLVDPEPAQVGQAHVALDRGQERRQVPHQQSALPPAASISSAIRAWAATGSRRAPPGLRPGTPHRRGRRGARARAVRWPAGSGGRRRGNRSGAVRSRHWRGAPGPRPGRRRPAPSTSVGKPACAVGRCRASATHLLIRSPERSWSVASMTRS